MSTLSRALLIAAALGAVWFGGAQYGRSSEVERSAQLREKAVAEAVEVWQENTRLASRHGANADQAARAASSHAAQLLKELEDARRQPLVVVRHTKPSAVDVRHGGTDTPVLRDGDVADEHPVAPPASGDPEPVLTAGAVRLWNSALTGAHDTYAGCSADDPSSEACTAGVGDLPITLVDVWANHITNATSCYADRARLTELQNYVRAVSSAAFVPH